MLGALAAALAVSLVATRCSETENLSPLPRIERPATLGRPEVLDRTKGEGGLFDFSTTGPSIAVRYPYEDGVTPARALADYEAALRKAGVARCIDARDTATQHSWGSCPTFGIPQGLIVIVSAEKDALYVSAL